MNVSLMWNSVGFYQIAKLSIDSSVLFPGSCVGQVRYSRHTKLSIVVVLLGVAVCTVTDVSVNFKGFLAAFIEFGALLFSNIMSIIFKGKLMLPLHFCVSGVFDPLLHHSQWEPT
ncbi:hypothetical protein MLD38_019492 [Melastoma candidum]|uniref:Uncharacterized protein n=1 Tax=Melastoma candidum TaxID=119954 RepID=A0ACB9QX87_9MYRT|nr:hypothetical protein MLD38_019492 [Melastoma candidum]